ncbi:Crp/Fnr family transcriptional regulator [Danxiaibacter flavus]|uniref:Crp/Fnr family transcriptional regulator n=1 Tax=Danxiaibacter flavus TaxID=3049108 RepID=A0ABV3ZJZ9_9BACT|nr:Crp/Fnr family transcriptional regulator [Chitinophagaceae bacterium DXS]
MSVRGNFLIDNWNFKRESILQDLPSRDLQLLLAHTSEEVYKKGEIVFREGSYPLGIFYIVEGKVKKYKMEKGGRQRIIYIAKSGELIGYHAVLSNDRYSVAAATLEASRIIFISREDFSDAIQQSSVLAQRLLQALSHEFAVMCNNLSAFTSKTVRQRLAIHLLLLTEKYKTDGKSGQSTEILIGREDLASVVGTARENVIRLLTEFKEAGILQTKGTRITILDMSQLIAIASSWVK